MTQAIETLDPSKKSKLPPGFVLGPVLKRVEIEALLEFLKQEDRYAWKESDGSISRYTINYGWNYVGMEKDDYHFIEIPPLLQEIRQKLRESFSPDFQNIDAADVFDNIIVTFYEAGQYLIPHYDADNSKNPLTKRNFYFEEPILGLVVEADPSIGFSFFYHDGTGRPKLTSKPIYKVSEVDGSTFLIQGACRYAPYFHAIPPAQKLRISITIRQTVLPKDFHIS